MQATVTSAIFHSHHLNYIRNTRAIAVLWCVFTICFAIINIVVFLQPWLGDSDATDREGYFGLFESCKYIQKGYNLTDIGDQIPHYSQYQRLWCQGTWTTIETSVNPASTFFIGFSALITLICIAMFLVLFLFINPCIVFTICGVLQLISTLCMILGCIIYPSAWDSERVKEICETSSKYHVGKCEVRWAYILAVISIFDILILSILAIVLSRKQISNFKISTINYVDTIQPLENNGFTSEFHQYTLEKNSVREFIQNE